METTISQIQQLSYREGKTYTLAAAFVAGNILLPQLCHMLPQGGLVWLPIYFSRSLQPTATASPPDCSRP